VPLYTNGWLSDSRPGTQKRREQAGSEEEWYAERAREVVDQGDRGLKLYPFGGLQVVTPERLARGIGLVRTVREAVGAKIDVAVDLRRRLNLWSARRVALKLEPLDIAWLEEPILFDNADAMAARNPTLHSDATHNPTVDRPGSPSMNGKIQ
jgi:L-alanine-DL-glutamate epimerase-like enolase superfamily enzyme